MSERDRDASESCCFVAQGVFMNIRSPFETALSLCGKAEG